MKELCNLRWGIEKSFKTLKYDDCGIQFHSKKDEFVKMELYARYGFPGYMKNKEAFVADTEQHVKDGLVVKADMNWLKSLACRLIAGRGRCQQ